MIIARLLKMNASGMSAKGVVMKRIRLSGILGAALVAMAVVSCAKPPVAEMEAANQAMTRAESNADARDYAPESLSKARDLIARMKADADEKRYDEAKALAAEAAQAADKAIQDGASAKAKAKSDSSALVATVKSTLAEIQASFAAARKVRRIQLDIAGIDKGIKESAAAVAAAESDVAKGDYKAASTKAQGARSSLAGIQKLISDAVQAASRKK